MKILAVTACPTGIAHTYMAAEAIEEAAKAKPKVMTSKLKQGDPLGWKTN